MENLEYLVAKNLSNSEAIKIAGGEASVRQELEETVVIPIFTKPIFTIKG